MLTKNKTLIAIVVSPLFLDQNLKKEILYRADSFDVFVACCSFLIR